MITYKIICVYSYDTKIFVYQCICILAEEFINKNKSALVLISKFHYHLQAANVLIYITEKQVGAEIVY